MEDFPDLDYEITILEIHKKECKMCKIFKPSKSHKKNFGHIFVIEVCLGNSPCCCQTCTIFICSLTGAITIVTVHVGLNTKKNHKRVFFIYSNLAYLSITIMLQLTSRTSSNHEIYYFSISSFCSQVTVAVCTKTRKLTA